VRGGARPRLQPRADALEVMVLLGEADVEARDEVVVAEVVAELDEHLPRVVVHELGDVDRVQRLRDGGARIVDHERQPLRRHRGDVRERRHRRGVRAHLLDRLLHLEEVRVLLVEELADLVEPRPVVPAPVHVELHQEALVEARAGPLEREAIRELVHEHRGLLPRHGLEHGLRHALHRPRRRHRARRPGLALVLDADRVHVHRLAVSERRRGEPIDGVGLPLRLGGRRLDAGAIRVREGHVGGALVLVCHVRLLERLRRRQWCATRFTSSVPWV
jgi:hypothetical protein